MSGALGTLGFTTPGGEDYVQRQLADLRRQLRELGPSVAQSLKGTVETLEQTVTDVAAAQAGVAALVTKLAGLRTFATAGGDLTITRPAGSGGTAQAWTASSIDLASVVVPANCALLVTVSCGQATITYGATAPAGELTTSQLSFDVAGWAGIARGSGATTAAMQDQSRGSYDRAAVALSRQYVIYPPAGTYTLRAWGGGFHTAGAPATTHQFANVTLVAQVIPDSGF